jgi:hypothetical protein
MITSSDIYQIEIIIRLDGNNALSIRCYSTIRHDDRFDVVTWMRAFALPVSVIIVLVENKWYYYLAAW